MSQQRPPRIPPARQQTDRQRLIEILLNAPFQDAKELSAVAGISEKDVYAHIAHIEKSARQEHKKLNILPAECQSCGFVFTKHGHMKKPSRCPECRKERISPPSYSLVSTEESTSS